ncbi:glycoside hydrolase family 61 protein [Jaapia argillacea MUCL 33604]|uniref:AA9 family lytic polysaccharide monooxygenase n=1 Tax=Jaapia argillacea MUCL 33604 TaxID=933084 RepID=A0A067P6H1_9AGAM|nr:glycoside hydrolase family 61 protein [Jaapia argillacea MUCL 33604]
MKLISLALFSLWLTSVNAHTYVWSVWLNGVDQGSGVGIRKPAYNGPPSTGFNNGPVRDLNSIDMRCNVLGDIPDANTIKVQPNDVVTFEWHHNNRTSADDIIASSTKAPVWCTFPQTLPPTPVGYVKIQEEGEGPPGTWYVTGKNTDRQGKQDVQIPAGLVPGQYLLRAEFL